MLLSGKHRFVYVVVFEVCYYTSWHIVTIAYLIEELDLFSVRIREAVEYFKCFILLFAMAIGRYFYLVLYVFEIVS